MNTKKTTRHLADKTAKKAVLKKVVKVSVKTAVKKTKTATLKKSALKSKIVQKKKSVKKSKAIPAIKKNVEAKKVSHSSSLRLKRMVYMTLSVLLGLLLGTFVSLFLELVYMRKAAAMGVNLQTHYFLGLASYLPFFAQQFFLLAGLIFGVWLGFWGWKLVYIQKRHRMYRR